MVDLDLRELEHELCRLPEVSAARVVAGDDGRPVEIHVVATTGKHPKQVVRDVQSVALASFGLDLDRRIVSVVQFGGNGDGEREGSLLARNFRPSIDGITAEATGLRSIVRVSLRHEDETATGFVEGSVAMASRYRLIALATLDALRGLAPAAECLDIDSAQIVRVGAHDIAVVTVVFVLPPIEQIVSGSAVVRQHQEGDAVARAVLDATNRRLALSDFEPED